MNNAILELKAFFLNDESTTFEEILFYNNDEEALLVAKNRLEYLNIEYDENILAEVIKKIRDFH